MANIIASGDWWRLEEDGTLYVYCVGDMPDYGFSPPWANNLRRIRAVEIANSVTSISAFAFYDCETLISVSIPDSVTSIGGTAFYYCLSLTSVTIPNSVTSIGNGAFKDCTALESVTLSNSVTSIGGLTFFRCSSLTSVTIPDGVTEVESQAFYGCSSLESVTIPVSVANIDAYAFDECGALTDIYYGGTKTQWNGISVGSDNDPLENATIHYASEPVTLSSIAITTPPAKTAYTVGETFDPAGMVVTAAYSDASTATVTGYSVSPSGSLTTADTTITVSYTEDGATASATVAITVTDPQPEPDPEPVPTANRLRIQVIKPGGGALTFKKRAVKQLEYALSTSLDGKTVQTDQFTAIVRDTDPDWLSRWNGVNQACAVFLTVGLLTEKYYFKSITRVGKSDFQLTAQSPLGRLTDDFPGDIYSGTPLPDVIADVIGNVVPYTVNPLLESVRVHGCLPYQDRRTSLHQLALAYGFLIRRNANHDLYFTVPDTSAYSIPDNAIFTGGSVTYRFGETYARADITAYDYLESETEPKTLFDNVDSIPADNFIVKFDSPVFALQADDTLTVHKAGVNYAKVSGSGRLIGKPYTQIASVVSVDGDTSADPQHVLSVSDVPLITSLNAVTVGERLLSYYNAPAVVNADIVRTSQKPGDCVSFTDPFGDPQTGYITELSGVVSGIDRASAAVVCGYTPSWGAAFDTVDVLTGSGSWTVPASLDGATIRVVLIGGGSGGASGQAGSGLMYLYKADDVIVDDVVFVVGSGHGLPGDGGKVLDVKFTAVAGQTFRYSAGSGGAGGRAVGGSYDNSVTRLRPDNMTVYITRTGDRWHLNPHCNGGTYTPTTLKKALERHLTACENCVKDSAYYFISKPGEPGTASTFGDYSSNDGHTTTTGFYDVLDGIMYAAPGADNGVDGGVATTGTENGDRLAPDYNNVQRFTVSLPWDSSQSWTSGSPGAGKEHHETNPSGTINDWAYGGLGGGAAVGSDGHNGGNAVSATYGGSGGVGASAVFMFPDVAAFGCGGSGGHGGGEGGAGGTAHSEASYDGGASSTTDGSHGSGGRGTNGQNGAAGCILVYYKKPNALQYSFSVRDGQLILTYYTDSPPPFSINGNGQLVYSYADGETPPTFEIRDGILYKID